MTPIELNYNLLRRLARITFQQADVDEVQDLIRSPDLDKGLFLSACFKQKVAGLVYLNLRRWGFERLIPWMGFALQLFYAANVERNRRLQALAKEITAAFGRRSVDIRPLKGTVLVPLIYEDGGSRLLFDVDFFMNREDLATATAVFKELGYIQGTQDYQNGTIVPLSREEKLLWQVKMFEAPPFCKAENDDFLSFWGAIHVDLSFGFAFAEAPHVSRSVLASEAEIAGHRSLSTIDFFIQLCGHLFKEATNESWIELDLDINLIKFCDVREYVLKMFNVSQFQELRNRIQELKLERAVYFSLFYVHELYKDELIAELIASLNFSFADRGFMTEIYRQGTKPVGTREKTLVEAIGLS